MRTEEDVVGMKPIKAVLGTETYEINPLTITPQGAWREKLTAAMQPILASFEGDLTNISFANAYGVALRASPEVFCGLIFEYATALDPVKIKAEATEEQMSLVFQQIMDVAFPFAKPLEMVMRLTPNTSR